MGQGTEYERHEFSYAWPEIPNDQLGLLIQSMRVNGFDASNPITIYEGAILDGWHRYKAAARADVQPVFVEFNGTERQALNFVEMRNSSRRHMTVGQQATALRRIDLQRPESARRSVEEVAALLGTGKTTTVRNAFKLVDTAPDVAEAVASGRIAFQKAEREELEATTTNTKTTNATPNCSIRILERIDQAAKLKGKNFKPITPRRALNEALTLWCKAREEGKRLAIVDY